MSSPDRLPWQMGDVYASAIGTTVLQATQLFPCPARFEGVLCLFGVCDGVDEAAVRRAFGKLRGFEGVDLAAAPPVVRFTTHAAALRAMAEAVLTGVCAGVDMLYNERPYEKRGWFFGRLQGHSNL